jgi:hypothetical protein
MEVAALKAYENGGGADQDALALKRAEDLDHLHHSTSYGISS